MKFKGFAIRQEFSQNLQTNLSALLGSLETVPGETAPEVEPV